MNNTMICVTDETVEPCQKVQWVYLFSSGKTTVSSYCSSPGWKWIIHHGWDPDLAFPVCQSRAVPLTVVKPLWRCGTGRKFRLYPQQFAQIFVCLSVHEQKPDVLFYLWFFFNRLKDWEHIIATRMVIWYFSCCWVNALEYSHSKKALISSPFFHCVFGKSKVLLLAVNPSSHV